MSESGKENDTVVIYHANCPDGFFAAWAARRALGEDGVRYVACAHGNTPPDVKGKNVYVLDFSFENETLRQMNEDAKSMVVLDHHETSFRRFEGLWDFCLLDVGRSGAVMAWDYFFVNGMPELFEYVQDRDLWKWELAQSREVSAAVSSYPFEFELWDEMLEESGLVERLAHEGAGILRYQERQVERVCRNARWVNLEDLKVPVVNSAMLQSEIGGKLCEESPVAMIWFIPQRGHVKVSLRGDGTRDVAAIAESFPGGGGHPNAAGFNMDADGFYRLFLRGSKASKDKL